MDGLWFGTETVHHHGGARLPQEGSLIEQRTRLTLCQGDTIYHGAKGDEEEAGARGSSETPAKSGKKPSTTTNTNIREVTVGVRGRVLSNTTKSRAFASTPP